MDGTVEAIFGSNKAASCWVFIVLTTRTGVESEDDQDGDVKNLHCPVIDYQSEWRNYPLSGSVLPTKSAKRRITNHCTISLVKLIQIR